MTATQLVVNEMFGPTVQGEGADAGKPCVFLRLYGCPVQCTWCDTSYTWKEGTIRTEAHVFPVKQVADVLLALVRWTYVPRLVVSGGEPMAQASALHALQPLIVRRFPYIEVETSGVIPPYPGLRVAYNVSPKLKHAAARVPYKLDVLSQYVTSNARFKFVVTQSSDFEEVDEIVERIEIPRDRVWIMPEGTTAPAQIERAHALLPDILQRGYNLSLRQHILLWGNERGR